MVCNPARVKVSVTAVQGSGPREVGAWMLVSSGGFENTLGGGHLEFEALATARAWMAEFPSLNAQPVPQSFDKTYTLGPSLGQCCGGVVSLRFSWLTEEAMAAHLAEIALSQRYLPHVALFGGGHVGRAIVRALAPLPVHVAWIDSRDEVFPIEQDLPRFAHGALTLEHSNPVEAAVHDLQAGSRVLVMSFSHAEDLEIIAQCLLRLRAKGDADLPFVGLIGSQTKWASFKSRLRHRGFSDTELARITCPIGIQPSSSASNASSVLGTLGGAYSKMPEVIAASVAAQLLQTL